MTENLEFRVPVHLANPSGFVAQKSRPETNLPTTPAGGDEKQVFAVTLRRRRHDVKNGVTACSASKADPGCSSFVPLCVPEGQFVSSGPPGSVLQGVDGGVDLRQAEVAQLLQVVLRPCLDER